ncbi:Iron-sulfur cluster assembly 2, mitochondrial [Sparganum proliferum]
MLRSVIYRDVLCLWNKLPLIHALSKVTLSESCVKRLNEMGEKEGILRVMVDSGGCSGFQYKFLIEKNITEDDHVITQSGVRVVIDDQSYSLIDGSTLEYEEELIRSGFRVAKNPQAERGCSCGSSFAVRLD